MLFQTINISTSSSSSSQGHHALISVLCLYVLLHFSLHIKYYGSLLSHYYIMLSLLQLTSLSYIFLILFVLFSVFWNILLSEIHIMKCRSYIFFTLFNCCWCLTLTILISFCRYGIYTINNFQFIYPWCSYARRISRIFSQHDLWNKWSWMPSLWC